MKVLHVPPYSPPIEGGSERFCFNLSKLLIERGHKIKVFTSRWGDLPYDVVEGVPCYFFKNYKQMLGLDPLAMLYRRLPQGVDWADLVHAHSYIYFLGNQVALYRKKREFPFVLHLHGGTSPISSKVYGHSATMAKILYDISIGKWTVQAADVIMASSKNDARNAIERFKADPERIVYIPNSIYVEQFYSKPVNPPIVTFLARLTQLKGCLLIPSILKRVYQEHGNVKFWIVGEGSFDKFLKRELKGLPVKFWGMMPHAMVPKIFANSSVSYLPSYTESCPLGILESLASSVPVVAHNVGGIPEILHDGKTGFITQVEDVNQMADRIIHLLDNDKVRQKMSRAGRRYVEEHHSWHRTVEMVEEVYKWLL